MMIPFHRLALLEVFFRSIRFEDSPQGFRSQEVGPVPVLWNGPYT